MKKPVIFALGEPNYVTPYSSVLVRFLGFLETLLEQVRFYPRDVLLCVEDFISR